MVAYSKANVLNAIDYILASGPNQLCMVLLVYNKNTTSIKAGLL